MTSVVCRGRLPKSTDALIQIAIGRSSDTVPPRHSADLCRVLRWHDASGSEHAQRRHRPYTEDCRLRSQQKLQRSLPNALLDSPLPLYTPVPLLPTGSQQPSKVPSVSSRVTTCTLPGGITYRRGAHKHFLPQY